MRAFKTVQQHYTSSPEILQMLEEFRRMLNDCVWIGVAENVTSLKALSMKAYGQLAAYDVMSYYKLCAISQASGILRDLHRRNNLRIIGGTMMVPGIKKKLKRYDRAVHPRSIHVLDDFLFA